MANGLDCFKIKSWNSQVQQANGKCYLDLTVSSYQQDMKDSTYRQETIFNAAEDEQRTPINPQETRQPWTMKLLRVWM